MPCWYFERKEIKNSPSCQDGIDTATENRYRKEGARFIIDAGTKMGLRYDTCATGVIYFHRFYMFHSFKEFYRYVTAASCLFLAGKVEETPKKCKDIIKIAQSLMTSSCFQRFGDDPREEVITMERILLKTIKFDLQVEHPYSYMLKYAKHFKGEKEKTQKMAQMAWTFINDSLCTTLCLQWEPEIVAVSLMYLASRLTKFEPNDWTNRNSSKSKWWEDIIEGMSMELMEDICHQVLDLYSSKQKKMVEAESPPQSPAKSVKQQASPPPPPPPLPERTPGKRSRGDTPSDVEPPKIAKIEKERPVSKSSTPSSAASVTSSAATSNTLAGAPIPIAQHITTTTSSKKQNSVSQEHVSGSDTFTSYNPYVSSQMYSSSFMSQEGSQNIQSILAGGPTAPPPASSYPEHRNPTQPPHAAPDPTQYPPPAGPAGSYSYPPPPQAPYAPPPALPPHPYPPPQTSGPAYDPYAQPRNPTYPPVTYAPPPVTQPPVPHHSYPPPTVPPPQPFGSYSYPPAPTQGTPTHVPPPQVQPPPQVTSRYPPPVLPYPSQPPPTGSAPGYGGPRHYSKPPPKHGPSGANRKDIPALTEIKIAGRPEWNLPQ